eukprot:gene2736-3396_t
MSSELLLQLQPLLLIEELKKHQLKSLERQNQLGNESKTDATDSYCKYEEFMKQEHDYYYKKAKELKTLCQTFVQKQRLFISELKINPEALDSLISNHNNHNNSTCQYLRKNQLLISEITQVIAIVQTHNDGLSQLIREFELVESSLLSEKQVELYNLSKHLQILLKELESLPYSNLEGGGTTAAAAQDSAVLVLVRQPFPGIIKRFKYIQNEEFIVEMLPSSNFPYTYSKLKVHCLASPSIISNLGSCNINNNQNNQNNSIDQLLPPLTSQSSVSQHQQENSSSTTNNNSFSSTTPSSSILPPILTQPNSPPSPKPKSSLLEQQTFDMLLEGSRYIAKVPLKFIKGTTQFSTLKFSLNLIHKTTKEQVTIETEESEKFISFVNDSQWVEYFCLLLKEEIYLMENDRYLRTVASHYKVVTTIQKYFHLCLKIYKRSIHPYMPLPIEPLINLLNQVSEYQQLTIDQFDSFISILSPSFKVLKYQKHAIDLWNHGLIFLFLTNEKAKEYLNNVQGRFLLQFSSSHPYCWVIKYFDEGLVKDILVDMKNDLAGDRSNKSLVNYIELNLGNDKFKEICQYDYKQNIIQFVNKDEIINSIKQKQ